MTVAELGAAAGLIATIIGGWIFLDTRHAKDEDVKELSGYVDQRQKRIQQNFIQQQDVVRKQFLEIRLDSLRQRLWTLQDRGLCVTAKRECREVEAAIERTKRQMRD